MKPTNGMGDLWLTSVVLGDEPYNWNWPIKEESPTVLPL